jgi:TPR repeat protein
MLVTMTNIANSDQSSGSIYHLNSNDIFDLKRKAETDAKASYRLYEYYTLSEYNEEESMRWLEKSASLGHELAQFNYVKHFYDNGNKRKANSLAKKWKDNVEINKLFFEKNHSNKK